MKTEPKSRNRSILPGIALLLLILVAAGSAYFWPRTVQQLSEADPIVEESGVVRHRERIVDPALSDEEYQDKLVRLDKRNMDRRRFELRRLRKKFSLQNPRSLYRANRVPLEAMVKELGQGKLDSAPNSVVNEALLQLKRLEEDPPSF